MVAGLFLEQVNHGGNSDETERERTQDASLLVRDELRKEPADDTDGNAAHREPMARLNVKAKQRRYAEKCKSCSQQARASKIFAVDGFGRRV